MKVKYRNCEIECTRDETLSGDTLLFYSVFDYDAHNSGFEVTSGFSEGEDTIKDYIGYLKKVVDDYIDHPENYE